MDFFDENNYEFEFKESTFTQVQLVDEFLDSFNLFEISNQNLLQNLVQQAENFVDPVLGGNQIAAGGFGAAFGNNAHPNIVVKRSRPCPQNLPPNYNISIFYDPALPDFTPALRQMCKLSSEGSLIFRIPNTVLNKTNILCPNYISENLIGVLLYRILQRYTSSFVSIYNFAINIPPEFSQNIAERFNTEIYTSMERLQPIIPLINSKKKLFYILFQVCQGLSCSQELLKFTHYDLHTGNVLARTTPPNSFKINIYELDNGQYFYTRSNFDTVITDFGFSRIETPNHIIIPTTVVQYPDVRKTSAQEKGLYNPYIDIINFFYYAFMQAFRIPSFGQFPFDASPANPQNYNDIQNMFIRIFKRLLNLPANQYNTANDINNLITGPGNQNLVAYWRVKTQKINQLPFKPTKATQMMTKLALMCKELLELPDFNIIPPPAPPQITIHEHIVNHLQGNRFLLLDNYVEIPNGVYNGIQTTSVLYPQINHTDKQDLTFYKYRLFDDNILFGQDRNVDIDDGISVRYINGLPQAGFINTTLRHDFDANLLPNNPPNFNNYHRTPNQSMILPVGNPTSTFQNQLITIVSINQEIVLNNDYKFRSDCCKIDPRNYFQNSFMKSGVLINSTFFNLFKKTDTPIGYTRTNGIIFENPIPPLFRRYYGCVAINENGNLEILETMEGAEDISGDVITVGPLLVWNGVKRFTENMIANDRAIDPNTNLPVGPRIFQCADNVPSPDIHGCGMNPGELYHAGNPNPRSAVVIDTANNIHFIKVEGRDNRIAANPAGGVDNAAAGMDLSQLADFCINGIREVNRLKGIFVNGVPPAGRFAINLDGGGSSQIVFKIKNTDYITLTHGMDFDYPVGGILALVKEK